MVQYSFVVPIYNDGYLAETFCEVFSQVMRSYLGNEDIDGAVELIFVNDGSTDDSQQRLQELSRSRSFVRVVEFSRNFGHHIAVSCGYEYTTGDFVGLINVDMQDPPDQIPLLLDYLRNSECDIVIGRRPDRKDGLVAGLGSRMFFATMNFLTNSHRPTNLSVLRVMTRRFVEVYNRFSERRPYVNGLEEWLGFKEGYVAITHRQRATGKSSYTFFKKIRLAFDAILSFSDLPLKLTAGFGLVCTAVGFALCSYLVIARMLSSGFQPGFTATISVVVFLGGVQILSIGLLSLYVGRILQDVQKRPRFVIKSTTNLPGLDH
jgi:glycosyltransferase involved in cell wall biosynthesis